MPLAKIHVLEGRYDERRLSNVSKAVQDALVSIQAFQASLHAHEGFPRRSARRSSGFRG
jgi:hypothetical protein